MATKLTRPVSRELPLVLDSTPLVVTLTVAGILFRLKRSKTSFLLPYGLAYQRAAQLEADQRVRTKRVRRASRGLLTTGVR